MSATELTVAAPAEELRVQRLTGRVVLREELGAEMRSAMFALLAAHFVGVELTTFEADLAEKSCAILLEDEQQRLRGFSTLLVYESTVNDRVISVVYSGDTIVERGWWGSPALPRTWIRAVRQLGPLASTREVYWFLLTSGYRTYRFLPVFFRSFHPRFDAPTADTSPPLVDAIARARFGKLYDTSTGIVRFPRPQILRSELLELPCGRTLDPHIAYFVERNPGHVRGDELACLARVHDDNLTPAGRRMCRVPQELQA
jgi:hypothetical protein